MLTEEMQNSVQEVYNYSGIYISYSLSSSSHSLKVEPYLISASENNSYVRVMHMNTYNTTHCGIGMFSNHQNAYIMFNEREMPQMALFTIYLQLPMYDFPHMLKGLYLCLDYNRNPIARRILFIKHSDSTNIDDFLLKRSPRITRRINRRDTSLLRLYLPAGRLHQNMQRPFSITECKRSGQRKKNVGNLVSGPNEKGVFISLFHRLKRKLKTKSLRKPVDDPRNFKHIGFV